MAESGKLIKDTVQNISAIAEVCTILNKVMDDTIKFKNISEGIDDKLHNFKILE